MRASAFFAALIFVASCAPTGSGPGDRTSSDVIQQIKVCQGETSRADERLRIARIGTILDSELVVDALAFRSKSVPGAFVFLARDETQSDSVGQWRAACKAPEPTQYVTGREGLYRSCLSDAAVVECLEESHGWRRLANKPGMLTPP